MDLTFYACVVAGCIVLMLAMWACSAGGVNKWGPDLTLELPVDVIRDALYPQATVQSQTEKSKLAQNVVPSAPSEFLYDPLLTNAEPMGVSDPPTKFNSPPPFLNSTAVRVLPTNFHPNQKMRPPVYSFTPEKPAV